MSITSDIRSYADSAVSQGKQVLDQSLGNVSDIGDKASEAVADIRTSAEKAINIDAIKHTVEPYLAQVKGYGSVVTDRAEELFTGLTSDKRVSKIVDTAGSVTTVVLTQVQERVIKPVQSLTGFGASQLTKPTRTTKPAATKPAASTPATRRPATATKASPKPQASTAKVTTAKTTARKAPAKTTPKV